MQPRTRKTIFASVAVVLLALAGAWWYFGFTFDFSKFFAAGPGVGGGTTTAAVTGMVSCAPATQTVAKGATVTLTASSGTGTYTWFMPERGLSSADTATTKTGPSISIFYDVPGTKKVTVQAARGDGSANIDSVACTVVVTP